MEDNIIYRCTMLCDDYVELPDGERISHYEYNQRFGTHYQPGPLVTVVDWRNPAVRAI